MPVSLSDAKFADLKAKLRELFELDKSDLDFGIYRIMAAKNKEVTEFLDRQLKDKVREILSAHGEGAASQIEAEIEKARAAARDAGFDPEQSPRVKELQARLASAGGASASELEADIYNHLLAFFSRYYDEGDFISKRRYKGDVYAIPYAGEEVALHWANRDQYYIKSGEWHKDYRFKVAGKSVRFKLIEATQETNNNKERDDAKRRYILDEQTPIEQNAHELTLRFQFRVPTAAEKERAADRVVAIFGGDFARAANPKKGDEREQFCADAEKRARSAMPESWQRIVGAAAPTDSMPARSILGKHLNEFTARNTFDYFIHKDLGGFLRRELDFYLKNEIVRLDDLESLPTDHLAKVQSRVKAIRAVAGRIIEFVATIENFQKKLWTKKKFVLETNWLVTIDRIPEKLRDAVAENESQWRQWEALGFTNLDSTPDDPTAWGTREYIERHDKLVVDTGCFGRTFAVELAAAMRAPVEQHILVHSDNFHALNLLKRRYAGQIQCIYIDPPYNTGSSAVLYKNEYKHSAWWTMMQDRVRLLHLFLARTGALFGSIDKNERLGFQSILDDVFGATNLVEELVWTQNTANSQLPNYSTNHEFVEVYARDRVVAEADKEMFRETKPGFVEIQEILESMNPDYPSTVDVEVAIKALFERHVVEFKELLEQNGIEWTDEAKKQDPWKGIYLYCNVEYRDSQGNWVPEGESRERSAKLWVWREISPSAPASKQSPTTRDPHHFNYRYYKPVHPDTGVQCPHPKGGWKFPHRPHPDHPDRRTFVELAADRRIAWGDDENKVPQTKGFLHEVETNICTSAFYEYNDGEAEVSRLFGESGVFLSPKSSKFVRRFVAQSTGKNDYVLDCFGGSASTAHAVLDENRSDSGTRQFLLVEVGKHFNTVVRPRVSKVICGSHWRDGKLVGSESGVSAVVKYFTLESYEDALDNLPAPDGQLYADADAATRDSLITYGLDLELGPHLLNLDIFRDPWGYRINAQPAGEDEIRPHAVDLVETFNYLLGLKVHAYGPLERYRADFERARHDDQLGRLKVVGRPKRDAKGPFTYQRVEGELLDGTRVLVIWRKLTDDPEKDAAMLDAWMERHRESTTERSQHRDYHQIYVNGPVTLPQPTAEIRTVMPIEQTFKDRMFADAEGDAHG